jgi:primosomal protein N' (replication factor Y) (superfamily II helicase)
LSVPETNQEATFAPGAQVAVLLPLPLEGLYDYRVAPEMVLAPGDFVEVPFRGRRLSGVVWGRGTSNLADARIKEVLARHQAPRLPEVSRRFLAWVANYTVCPPGAVLRMAMSVPEALRPPRGVAAFALARDLPPIRWTEGRLRVREVLAGGPPRPATEIAREAAAGPSTVAGLARAGALVAVDLPAPPPPAPDWSRPGPQLSAAQAAAAAQLRAAIAAGFSVQVLDGVAGSGKTEVYFDAIAEALRQGRQALVLLPEIALGAQWLGRFAARFGALPRQWHSDLARGYRRKVWRETAEGRARVVVGARSALFLPFADLGLIVVDEEHDPAFKQEEGVIYHARDMAVVRARLGDIPVALVSATPSLETVVNIARGRYAGMHLPARHAGAALPEIAVVDMRREGPRRGTWLSPRLHRALDETLADRAQSLLFLNRRGYAPLTLCRSCGHRLRCPNCTAWLVEHRRSERLHCHHCGYRARIPRECPACAATGSLVGCGPGVERLAEEVAQTFPDARCAIATSDTLSGPEAAASLVRSIEAHALDIVIGTQILAKGYHFPLLTLVGVIDADLGLAGGDLRAAERTYQLLSQVSGRAGRAERPGRVLVQTYMPEHPVIAALAGGDRDGFIAAEARAREEAGMPPFARLAALIVSGVDELAVEAAARALARAAPRSSEIRVLGPAPAPLALLRGRHRRRLLLQAASRVGVPAAVRTWLAGVPVPHGVRIQVDIDPYSFF